MDVTELHDEEILTRKSQLTMLRDFIAIDFETANQEPSSVCSVGVVMVRDGQGLVL